MKLQPYSIYKKNIYTKFCHILDNEKATIGLSIIHSHKPKDPRLILIYACLVDRIFYKIVLRMYKE